MGQGPFQKPSKETGKQPEESDHDTGHRSIPNQSQNRSSGAMVTYSETAVLLRIGGPSRSVRQSFNQSPTLSQCQGDTLPGQSVDITARISDQSDATPAPHLWLCARVDPPTGWWTWAVRTEDAWPNRESTRAALKKPSLCRPWRSGVGDRIGMRLRSRRGRWGSDKPPALLRSGPWTWSNQGATWKMPSHSPTAQRTESIVESRLLANPRPKSVGHQPGNGLPTSPHWCEAPRRLGAPDSSQSDSHDGGRRAHPTLSPGLGPARVCELPRRVHS